jgi:hypothetical protein
VPVQDLDFWIEPLWLVYPVIALTILTALFAWSVRWWLAEFPVMPLNHTAEIPYRTPARTPTNFHQYLGVMAATASSAVAFVHPEPFLYDPRTGKRIR